MAPPKYRYVIVGAGLAGGSAVAGIRELDPDGAILLLGDEPHRPYERPPLSKQLWTGKKQVADLFLQPEDWYPGHHVDLKLGAEVVGLDPAAQTVTLGDGSQYAYEKLLLATGGRPRRLEIPGGDAEGVLYYRYLDDYLRIRPAAHAGKRVAVVGGGFIGSELAAALNLNQVEVTMIFPGSYLVGRVFPESLGRALQAHYEQRGVRVLTGDAPAAITPQGEAWQVATREGQTLGADFIIAGVGIYPLTDLAQQAGLEVADGIVVNDLLQTSHPNIYAAGDNALFNYMALGERKRVEHWDNAVIQGQWAGRNMAGAGQAYDYMPYFYSDLFEFGYEAVGEIDPRLDVFADWQQENETGVLYFRREGKLRGAMMCNVWDQVPAARELIRSGKTFTVQELRGAIN
ncbi:MAG TPA: FAD-dependent oxidoreductase [Armatimonadota bacterium]|jgi:NADPH-dependent 2,4-dienoyl-CoA reductase/sulfur reductase-like enzyme